MKWHHTQAGCTCPPAANDLSYKDKYSRTCERMTRMRKQKVCISPHFTKVRPASLDKQRCSVLASTTRTTKQFISSSLLYRYNAAAREASLGTMQHHRCMKVLLKCHVYINKSRTRGIYQRNSYYYIDLSDDSASRQADRQRERRREVLRHQVPALSSNRSRSCAKHRQQVA